MNDNRMNEPTEAMILAGLNAYSSKGLELDGYETTEAYPSLEMWGGRFASQMRAALVAAQGAAPQAEIVPKPSARVATRSFDSDCAHGTCPSGCSHLMWICDTCSCEGGWGATRDKLKKWAAEHVCPVLPSSGVDEDALAEVLSQHVLGAPNGGTASWAWLNCSCAHRIEIAGVTREHVVALGRKHQARAVGEWFKEQGR